MARNLVILSEDHVVEAIKRYISDPPFSYEFEYIELLDFQEETNPTNGKTEFKFEFELFGENK